MLRALSETTHGAIAAPHDRRSLIFLREELNSDLGTKFDRIYDEALEIWNSEPLPKYTTHGRDHMKQVEKNLDDLTRPLQNSSKRLSEDEIFVLLPGACLHDIGACAISTIPMLRENHPVAAYKMILYSWNRVPSEMREVTLSIDDDNAREAIPKSRAVIGLTTRYRCHKWITRTATNGDASACWRCFGNGRSAGRLFGPRALLSFSHRLFGFNPLAELHHVKHKLVKGFSIGPPDNGFPNLRFDLQWKKYVEIKDGIEEVVNSWLMQWFNAQCRQLHPALYEESRGLIRWTQPWSNIIFREVEGPGIELSTAARHFLMAERAEQVRIDREVLAARFQEAVVNKEAAVFLFTDASDFDWQRLSEWCVAYARSRRNCQVANLEVRGPAALHLGDILAQIMTQWGTPLPVYTTDEVTKLYEKYVKLDDSPDLVTIVRTDEAGNALMPALLTQLMSRKSAAARVCFLICPKAKGPAEVGDATIIEFDGSSFPRAEVEDFLRKKHGYSTEKSRKIYDLMESGDLTYRPMDVYWYIENHWASEKFGFDCGGDVGHV